MYKMHKNEVGNDTSMFSGRKCKLCGLKVSESIEKHLEVCANLMHCELGLSEVLIEFFF